MVKDNPFYFGRKTQARGKPKDPEAVKRGRRSKNKGKHREDELKTLMALLTGEEWERRGGDNDVQTKDSSSPWRSVHVECKGHKRVAAMRFCEQAMVDAARQGKPEWITGYREDAKPGYKKPMWIVQVPLQDYVRAKMAEFACGLADPRDLRTVVDALKLEGRVQDDA